MGLLLRGLCQICRGGGWGFFDDLLMDAVRETTSMCGARVWLRERVWVRESGKKVYVWCVCVCVRTRVCLWMRGKVNLRGEGGV